MLDNKMYRAAYIINSCLSICKQIEKIQSMQKLCSEVELKPFELHYKGVSESKECCYAGVILEEFVYSSSLENIHKCVTRALEIVRGAPLHYTAVITSILTILSYAYRRLNCMILEVKQCIGSGLKYIIYRHEYDHYPFVICLEEFCEELEKALESLDNLIEEFFEDGQRSTKENP